MHNILAMATEYIHDRMWGFYRNKLNLFQSNKIIKGSISKLSIYSHLHLKCQSNAFIFELESFFSGSLPQTKLLAIGRVFRLTWLTWLTQLAWLRVLTARI